MLKEYLLHITNILLKQVTIEIEDRIIVFHHICAGLCIINLLLLKRLDVCTDRVAWDEAKEKEGQRKGAPQRHQIRDKATNGICYQWMGQQPGPNASDGSRPACSGLPGCA